MANPVTTFESNGGTAYTTLAEEATFVTALVAANPSAITKTVLPNSYGGRAMYTLTFGTPSTTRRPLVLIASVHGNETMPREAALQLCRWLVETTDAAVLALLAQRQVIVVPTGNPDGHVAGTVGALGPLGARNNDANQDINRHYLDRVSNAPESAALGDILLANLPLAVLDCHEWMGAPGGDCFVGAFTLPGSDVALRQLAFVVGETMKVPVKAATPTPTCYWYKQETPVNSVQHLASTLGAVYTLFETANPTETIPAYGSRTPVQRANYQLIAMKAWLGYYATGTNAADAQLLGERVRNRYATRLARGETAWYVDHNSFERYTVLGYQLSAGDWTTAQPVLAAHGVTYDATARKVWLDQPKAYIAVALLDPSAASKVVSGASRLVTFP